MKICKIFQFENLFLFTPMFLFTPFYGNGCSLFSLILAKLLLSDINSENVFALSIVTASGVATGGGGGSGVTTPSPLSLK